MARVYIDPNSADIDGAFEDAIEACNQEYYGGIDERLASLPRHVSRDEADEIAWAMNCASLPQGRPMTPAEYQAWRRAQIHPRNDTPGFLGSILALVVIGGILIFLFDLLM